MILTWANMVTGLMVMDLCTDLMGSGSWILTIFCVMVSPGLCFQPARTTVPEVSYVISFEFRVIL